MEVAELTVPLQFRVILQVPRKAHRVTIGTFWFFRCLQEGCRLKNGGDPLIAKQPATRIEFLGPFETQIYQGTRFSVDDDVWNAASGQRFMGFLRDGHSNIVCDSEPSNTPTRIGAVQEMVYCEV